MADASRILSLVQLLAWRQGQSGVVFTNGVFDILHAGHVATIEFARGLGTALVVGVNGDASARLLGKGDDRPLNPAGLRARTVAALRAVDRVIVFDDPTAGELIRALCPDTVVKGADYRAGGLPEAAAIEAVGARLVFAPLMEGLSTTTLVRRIRGTT